MIKVYKIDKVACLKHMAVKDGLSISYWSKTEESWREEALQKKKQRVKWITNKTAEYGPSNFLEPSNLKWRADTGTSNPAKRYIWPHCDFVPNPHPEVLGKQVHKIFHDNACNEKWYERIIVSYNSQSRKYAVYFFFVTRRQLKPVWLIKTWNSVTLVQTGFRYMHITIL